MTVVKELKPMDMVDVNVTSEEGRAEFMEFLANWNTPEYTVGKLNEELFELGEVINKIQNKSKEYRPLLSALTEELGDVALRSILWVIKKYGADSIEGVMNAIEERINAKLVKMHANLIAGKYERGI